MANLYANTISGLKQFIVALREELDRDIDSLKDMACFVGILHNPRNIEKYFGKIFITHSGLSYSINKKGQITSKSGDANNGSTVSLIAGIDPALYTETINHLGNKKSFDNFMYQNARRPGKGRDLLLSVTEEDFSRTGIAGIVTGPIVKMESPTFHFKNNTQ